MGRGGGSHGGGGHSGGRSFGGRSGGGFGGGRGTGRGPGGPRFGDPGFGGSPPGGSHFGGPHFGRPGFGGPRRRWGGPIFPGGRWGGPGRRGGCGCSAAVLVIVVLLLFFSYFITNSGSGQSTQEVTVSRTERAAVTGTETYGEWYLDELDFIDHDTDLTDGLKYFYSQTGIQPYVMLLDYDTSLWNNGEWSETAAEEYLAQVYNETFSDNGHLIFAYFACENDSENMDGIFYFYYGSTAYSIMDDEAETIFWSYFDMNYNDLDQSIAEFIGQTFRETADNIMRNGIAGGNFSLMRIVTVFVVICVVVIFIAILVLKRANRKEDRRSSV